MTGSDFWSRRKAAVVSETEADERAEEDARLAAEERARADRPDAELLAEHGLPEPESLESVEGVQAFLKAELPQRLKTRALRQLWRMNPVLANVDGLVDYGEDFTDGAMVVEHLTTAYQVGKGMLAQFENVPEEEPVEEFEEPEPAKDLVAVTDADADGGARKVAADAPEEMIAPAEEFDEVVGEAYATSRRMRFRFEEAT